MKKIQKAFLSVILSVIFLVSAAAPGFARENSKNSKKTPIILVAGQGIPLYNQEGEEVYPIKFDVNAALVGEAFVKLNPGFTKGYLTGDFSDYCDAVCDFIDPYFKDIRLDNNGDCTNGIVSKPHGYYVYKQHNDMVYRFHYDWRLDPLEIIDELDEYIDYIKAKTGSEKVCIIGRCLGANIVTAYIDQYGVDKLEKYIMYCSALWGIEFSSELFSGDFTVEPDSVETYILNVLGNDLVKTLIKGSVSLLNSSGGLNLATDFVNKVYDQIKDDLIPRLIMLTYGTYPSYWSMVSPGNYEKARDFVFSNGREEEYAGIVRKIDYYHENIQLRSEEILRNAQAKGLMIGNICKYGKSMAPVVEDVQINADEMVSVYAASLGATTKGYKEPLDEEYIEEARLNGREKYISPDKQIDASTCLFPDTTWFVKNVKHRAFPECIETDLMLPFFRYDGEMTVDSDENLPQYLVCDVEANTLRPMTAENEDTEISATDNFKMLFKNILKKTIELLKKLFKTIFSKAPEKA